MLHVLIFPLIAGVLQSRVPRYARYGTHGLFIHSPTDGHWLASSWGLSGVILADRFILHFS